ncbi:MAG: hypothetical protein IJW70_04035 [Clostridia bacterium]|nr:hypothetical protein [Clostridia bacterium]
MPKKIFVFLILLLLTVVLVSCHNVPSDHQSTSSAPEKEIVGGVFSVTPFFDIQEGTRLSDTELKTVIASIPRDTYEAYPATHGAPLTATLYKDGEVITIDPNDPRLIALTNFFNNCVYHSKCSYTQGLLSIGNIEEDVMGADFRLELTYTPYGDKGPMPYGNETSGCDTIIFTNFNGNVTLIAHDLPGYEGQEDQYPYLAVGFAPLYGSYPLLELFGF